MAMGYFKNQNLAIFLFFIGFLLTINCTKVQKEEGNINKPTIIYMNNNLQLPQFDIEKYESNLKKNPNYEGYQRDEETYVKQYHGIKEGYVEEEYTKSIVRNYIEEIEVKNLRTRDVFTFNTKGSLQSVQHYFAFNLEIGKWKFYENNSLVKTIDKDKNYPFSLEKVIKFGKEHDVDFTKTGVLSRSHSSQYGAYIWDLNWNTGKKSVDGSTSLFKNYVLDGTTGKILFTKEYNNNVFRR